MKILVDGRPAVLVGCHYDGTEYLVYRFEGETTEHWMFSGAARVRMQYVEDQPTKGGPTDGQEDNRA